MNKRNLLRRMHYQLNHAVNHENGHGATFMYTADEVMFLLRRTLKSARKRK